MRRAGSSTQLAVFLDSTGRAYSLPAHSLPSARGQGEPLSGRLNPPDGASFRGAMIGEPDARWLVASTRATDSSCGSADLHSRNRAGKAALRLKPGWDVRGAGASPAGEFPGDALVAAVSSEGHLLVFAAAELPELPRGKGNRILGIPSGKLKSGEEKLVAVAVLAKGEDLIVRSGQRTMTLKAGDLGHYAGAARPARAGAAAGLAQRGSSRSGPAPALGGAQRRRNLVRPGADHRVFVARRRGICRASFLSTTWLAVSSSS